MPADDKFLAMRCRRILAKKECDMALMEIAARHGVIHLTGQLRKPRWYRGYMDLRDELVSIEQMLRRMPEVNDVINEVRILD